MGKLSVLLKLASKMKKTVENIYILALDYQEKWFMAY
jgi:hypothetical protein